MDFFLGHGGVDWIAGLCMVLMLWRVGQHKRDGFLWSAGAAIAWIVFNARLSPVSAPGVAINAIVLAISIRSYLAWSPPNQSPPDRSPTGQSSSDSGSASDSSSASQG